MALGCAAELEQVLMMMKTIKKLSKIGLLAQLAVLLGITGPVDLFALSNEQRRAIDSGARYVQVDTDCRVVNGGAASTGVSWPANIDQEWVTLWTEAAAQKGVDPKLLAAIFSAEHAGDFPPPSGDGGSAANGGWRRPANTAGAAAGPFQFIGIAWDTMVNLEPSLPPRTDGGANDPRNNPRLASLAAATYLTTVGGVPGLPAGSGDQPQGFKPGRSEVPYTAASVGIRYNQGPAWHDGLDVIGGNRPFEYADQVVSVFTQLGTGVAGQSFDACSVQADTSSLESAITLYAWDTYRGLGTYDLRPAYDTAINRAIAAGEYVGGVAERDRDGNIITTRQEPGVDCGGFVTRVMRDSGYDTNYNSDIYGDIGGYAQLGGGTTTSQRNYLRNEQSGWEQITVNSTADLQLGDVAMDNPSTHTYIWIGDSLGFETGVASSSWSTSGDGRAPMSGRENPLSSRWEWYRKVQ